MESMSAKSSAKPKALFIMENDVLREYFACSRIRVVVRVLAAIFVRLTYLGIDAEGTGLISPLIVCPIAHMLF